MLLLIALIFTIAGVFCIGGGATVTPYGIIYFAVAVIVVVSYIINLVVDWIASNMGGPWAAIANMLERSCYCSVSAAPTFLVLVRSCYSMGC